MQSNNECDTSTTDAPVSSEVILGVFLSQGSVSSVTDDLHINSVWAGALWIRRDTERESEKGKEGGTASLCVSYYRRHMARWIEILTIPYVLVLNGFTYFRFFVNSYIVNNLRSFIYNVLLNWVAGNRHQQNIFINFIYIVWHMTHWK